MPKPRLAPANTDRPRPSRAEAEKAVETLIRWAGDDPEREGLRDTPARVARAYEEFFAGYSGNPEQILSCTFAETGGYDDFVLVKGIDFVSHCEHHMLPIVGRAHVAYWPKGRILGISKLGRIVDLYAKRLTCQETMTGHILESIDRILKPDGTAVVIEAVHQCMTIRGVGKPGSSTVTSRFSGVFREDFAARERFLSFCR